jgi:Hint domain/LAGLIDADG-like domain
MGAQLSGASTTRERTNQQPTDAPALRCRITFRDGRHFAGALPPARHRLIQLAMLHRHTEGLVELTPGTRDLDGRLHVDRRSRPEHYLPGGASGRPAWLRNLLEHAAQITAGEYARRTLGDISREEVFVGVSARHEPRGSKHAVSETRFLWVDIDRPERLEVLWDFLAERPCHLLVETAGSGGVHAYWELDRALPARFGDREPIEQANLRIIHALGDDVADPNCFPAGTLVLTDRGYRPIEDLKRGQRVLTHRGRWRSISETMRRHGDTVTVKGHGHPGLEVTPNHRFLCRTRTPRWLHGPFQIGAPAWVSAESLGGLYWATPLDVEPLEIPPVGGRGMDFTPQFWWLIGRWLGDGWIVGRRPHSCRKGERSAVVELCCGHSEREALAARLKSFEPPISTSFARRGELRWSKRMSPTTTVFSTGHEGLAAWLLEHFRTGSLHKRLPAFVFGMPVEWRAALLEGYVSADGAFTEHRRQAGTGSISKQLSLGIRHLAETLGHRAALYCSSCNNGVIEGRKVRTHAVWQVRWKVDPRRHDAFADGGYSWLRVKDVGPGRRNVEVFNIAVEEDESYIVEGLVVHNCRERSRVLRLAGTINYKTRRYARIIEANLALPPYAPAALVGDLRDPHPPRSQGVRLRQGGAGEADDPFKRIPAPEYFAALAGIKVPPRGGLVRCPAHDDEHPSCSVAGHPGTVWSCHACGAGGTLYDLASAVLGGPTGHALRGDAFKRARAYVIEVLGEAPRSNGGGEHR